MHVRNAGGVEPRAGLSGGRPPRNGTKARAASTASGCRPPALVTRAAPRRAAPLPFLRQAPNQWWRSVEMSYTNPSPYHQRFLRESSTAAAVVLPPLGPPYPYTGLMQEVAAEEQRTQGYGRDAEGTRVNRNKALQVRGRVLAFSEQA